MATIVGALENLSFTGSPTNAAPNERGMAKTKMKKKTLIYVVILIVAVFVIIFDIKLRSDKDYEKKAYTWYSELGTNSGNLLVRGAKVDEIRNDIHKLVFALNESEKDPEAFRTAKDKEPKDPPKLKLIDIKGQVVNVEVINDEYLTQRMGSAGAEEFLVIATFTLTEYDHIKFVNFKFQAGDHAIPGFYSRDHFLKTWKIAN